MFNWILYGVLFLVLKSSASLSLDSLELVVATFRHGHRTNDAGFTYPKDPYINETYAPYGFGELTNTGKQREYKLGTILRKRYNKFLGRLYEPEILDATSTDMRRAQNSLQLVLAGLFPPSHTELEWNFGLNWNPIAYSYVPFSSNRLMTLPLDNCPRYKKFFDAYLVSEEGLRAGKKFSSTYDYLSFHTGLNVSSMLQAFRLYFTLTIQKEMGFKLPSWTNKVYPKYLESAAIQQFQFLYATPEQNQLFGGFLLKKIISDMHSKINGSSTAKNLKIYLYSAHDITVASLMAAMDVYYPHIPNYGACIIMELHKKDKEYFIKLFYENHDSRLKELTVPGCTFMCPFSDFVKLVQKNLPGDGDPCIV